MSVRIYVEGGGDQQATLAKCRKGFSQFFGKVVPAGHMPKVIACGGRESAFNDFCTALRVHATDVNVLLVDSEDAVAAPDCWAHLATRDNWKKPVGVDDKSVYLMVRCMESWFMADKSALVSFYGSRFLLKSLPGAQNVETIEKLDVANALDHATAPTGRKYHKTQHGFDILASLDVEAVARGSAHAAKLITYLKTL